MFMISLLVDCSDFSFALLVGLYLGVVGWVLLVVVSW